MGFACVPYSLFVCGVRVAGLFDVCVFGLTGLCGRAFVWLFVYVAACMITCLFVCVII